MVHPTRILEIVLHVMHEGASGVHNFKLTLQIAIKLRGLVLNYHCMVLWSTVCPYTIYIIVSMNPFTKVEKFAEGGIFLNDFRS